MELVNEKEWEQVLKTKSTEYAIINDDNIIHMTNNGYIFSIMELEEIIFGSEKILIRRLHVDRKDGNLPNFGWVINEFLTQCMNCEQEFNFCKWRHHCRCCGALVCNGCSPHRGIIAEMKGLGPVRICGRCFWGQEIVHVRYNSNTETTVVIQQQPQPNYIQTDIETGSTTTNAGNTVTTTTEQSSTNSVEVTSSNSTEIHSSSSPISPQKEVISDIESESAIERDAQEAFANESGATVQVSAPVTAVEPNAQAINDNSNRNNKTVNNTGSSSVVGSNHLSDATTYNPLFHSTTFNTDASRTSWGLPVVIDQGSGILKAGFANENHPRVKFPCIVGLPKYAEVMSEVEDMRDVYYGYEAEAKRGVLTLHHPVQRGVVTNWEDMETIWNHVYRDELRVASEDHPVLLTEAPMNPTRNRERTVQIMFETFQVPALYVKMQAVLALLATGHTTGLAVDCGDGVTHAVPVLEGYAVDTAVSRLDLAGSDVTLQLMKILRERGNTFSTTAEREIVRGVKEKLSYVALDYQAELAAATANHGATIEMSYELPDGNVIKLGAERFRCSELLFQPMLVGRDVPGLHECVHTSITHCDIDMRRELSANIFLSGGSTLMPGFGQRLTKEITALSPGGVAVKVHSPAERQHSVWLGGSVLASSESFGEMWISKGDYAEFGENVAHKCF